MIQAMPASEKGMGSVLTIKADYFQHHFAPNTFDLVIADPPYGGSIVKESWDDLSEDQTVEQYVNLMCKLLGECKPGASAYVFGGIGSKGNRGFLKAISAIEESTSWEMSTLITWKKKRAYGIQWGYLFTREEIAFFVLDDKRHPKTFNVPLLREKRGYAGYNPKYPAHSEFKRRSNVWTDVTEILRGKVHPCQKPDELYRIMVDASSNPGDTILDPFAGSGTLGRVGLDRNRIMVEQD